MAGLPTAGNQAIEKRYFPGLFVFKNSYSITL
jgi:hypothetical protein